MGEIEKSPGEPLELAPRAKSPLVQPAGNCIYFQNSSDSQNTNDFHPRERRSCHRKGCSNRFLPRRSNQRFCLEPFCTVELRRWQAAKRQRRHRADSANSAKHRERERQRRLNKSAERDSSQPQADPTNPVDAWSRRTDIPKDFCDRPGCYEPKASSDRNTAKYCGSACRNAVHRVRRRERKSRTMRYSWPSSTVNYSSSSAPEISLLHQKRSNQHDSKTSSQSRPRPPPPEM